MTAQTFEKRRVAKTALEIPTLGLGGATLASIFQKVPDDQARRRCDTLWRRASLLRHGPAIRFRPLQHLMGDALRFQQEGKVISTRWAACSGRFAATHSAGTSTLGRSVPVRYGLRLPYDAVMRSFEDSLQRLGLPKVDILYVHDIGVMTHGEEANKPL